MFGGFKMRVVHLGLAHQPCRDTITRFNLQYADSIIIKKIGSIPEERVLIENNSALETLWAWL